jgi:hypothetical protein
VAPGDAWAIRRLLDGVLGGADRGPPDRLRRLLIAHDLYLDVALREGDAVGLERVADPLIGVAAYGRGPTARVLRD